MKVLVIICLSLFPVLLYAEELEPAKVSFKCNIHTVNKSEGQQTAWPLDGDFGGYCIIWKSKHKNEDVGHMGLLLYKDSHSGHFYAYDMICPMCYSQGVTQSIYMETNLVARCKRCYGAWQNIHQGTGNQTNYLGEHWLVTYKAELKGDILYISNY